MGLAKCAGTKISYNGTLPQSLSRYTTAYPKTRKQMKNRIFIIIIIFIGFSSNLARPSQILFPLYEILFQTLRKKFVENFGV